MHYKQQTPAKLLMTINRRDQVPKLVSINQPRHSVDRNNLLIQARNNVQSSPNDKYIINLLQQERKKNQQLRKDIEQLRKQSNNLTNINEALLQRIKQVQTSYRGLRHQLQIEKVEEIKRLKNNIYAQIQQYLRIVVQKMTKQLRSQKMTPLLEDKLQRFMQEIMQINNVSVEHFVRNSPKKTYKNTENNQRSPLQQNTYTYQNTMPKLIGQWSKLNQDTNNKRMFNSQADKYLTQAKERKVQQTRQQYSSIMQRLNGDRMAKSFAVGYQSNDRGGYSTTPSKRKQGMTKNVIASETNKQNIDIPPQIYKKLAAEEEELSRYLQTLRHKPEVKRMNVHQTKTNHTATRQIPRPKSTSQVRPLVQQYLKLLKQSFSLETSSGCKIVRRLMQYLEQFPTMNFLIQVTNSFGKQKKKLRLSQASIMNFANDQMCPLFCKVIEKVQFLKKQAQSRKLMELGQRIVYLQKIVEKPLIRAFDQQRIQKYLLMQDTINKAQKNFGSYSQNFLKNQEVFCNINKVYQQIVNN